MTINLSVPELNELRPRITVFGIGGAGGNAVANMIKADLGGVEFVVANTDAQALAQSACDRRIQMGASITEGLGAGSRPEIGQAAAEESLAEIMDHLSGCHMVFITAGMGGGTGTGAAPVVARFAKDQGILTVGVVTKPFQFEGARRMRVAEAGIEEFQKYADTLLIIPNQNLFRVANEHTTFADAFSMADEVLHCGVRGITDLMVMPGLINLDFADVRAVMNEMGKAMMGTGEAEGEKRALESAEAAISNPLLDDVSMQGARGVLINITGGPDLGLYEVDEAANRIRSEVDPEANIIVGSTFDENLEGRMRVSVVATGIDVEENVVPLPETAMVASLGGGGSLAVARAPAPTPSVVTMTETIREEFGAKRQTDIKPTIQSEERPAVTSPQLQPNKTRSQTETPVDVSVPQTGPVASGLRAGLGIDPNPAPEPISAVFPTDQQPVVESPPEELHPAAKRKAGLSVFDRMMAGVKSARQANRPAQDVQGTPPLQSMTRPMPTLERGQTSDSTGMASAVPQKPKEQLFSVSDEEEQLEIPAFLRRQAN